MKTISRLLFTLRSILRPTRADADLDEELAFHLERETAMHEANGLSRDDARREALKHFGGMQRYREECRDVRRTRWIDDARVDARFALRLIRHHPGFSVSVMLIAALGIAACATTFSLVSGVLLAPLPFSHPERIAAVLLTASDGRATQALPATAYQRIAAAPEVFEAIAAQRPATMSVDINGDPELLRVRLVTASYFRVFGIAPIAGRTFTDDEAARGEPVVLLGYETWRRRFGGADVLGKTITLSGKPSTIIGIMPARFRGQVTVDPAAWLPLAVTASDASVSAVTRIVAGVDRSRAESWLAANVAVRMGGRMGGRDATDSVAARPTLYPINEYMLGEAQQPLLVLLGAVLFVLMLVTANIATMILARSTARASELAVRRALGASTGRQLRQLITESVALTAIGGILGLIVTYWLAGMIRGLRLAILPRIENVGVDWRVSLFAFAAVVLTGAVGGIAPALAMRRASRFRIGNTASSRDASQRAATTLVIAQIALSVMLVVGAGLLVKGFMRVAPKNPGFELAHRATLFVGLKPEYGFAPGDAEAARRFMHAAVERMRQVDGVQDVATTSFLPLTRNVSLINVDLPNARDGAAQARAFENPVSPNFFRVMKIPIVRGREFTDADREGSEPVVIVNAFAASRWWPNANPIGQQIRFSEGRDRYRATVVGVAGDTRFDGTETRIRAEVFAPTAQSQVRSVSFVVATTVDPLAVTNALKRAVWQTAPKLPITEANDLASLASESVGDARFFSVAMTLFALAALTLSALGVHGLLSFAVAHRRREIGIRLALGASAARVGRLVLTRAVVMGAIGVAIGLGAARGLTRYMESLLLEVGATDATVFSVAAVSVLAIAVLAACAPAYQALRVDPVKSLRL
jgi:putative ABC transport system permease protein